jgi:hypothetical protein
VAARLLFDPVMAGTMLLHHHDDDEDPHAALTVVGQASSELALRMSREAYLAREDEREVTGSGVRTIEAARDISSVNVQQLISEALAAATPLEGGTESTPLITAISSSIAPVESPAPPAAAPVSPQSPVTAPLEQKSARRLGLEITASALAIAAFVGPALYWLFL